MNSNGVEKMIEASILETTTALSEQFPTAYRHLIETPVLLRGQVAQIRIHDLSDYLETIRRQLSDLKAAGRR